MASKIHTSHWGLFSLTEGGGTNLVRCSIVTKTYVSIDPENLFRRVTFNQLSCIRRKPLNTDMADAAGSRCRC